MASTLRCVATAGTGIHNFHRLPKRICRQQYSHGSVEDAAGACCPQKMLEPGAECQPGKATGQGDQSENHREDQGLGGRGAGALVEERGDGGDGNQPSLGVDPLKSGHGEEPQPRVAGPGGVFGVRDTLRHPAQRRRPAPLQDLEGERVIEEQAAQAQGDGEEHRRAGQR